MYYVSVKYEKHSINNFTFQMQNATEPCIIYRSQLLTLFYLP